MRRDHALRFERLANPADEFTFYSTCPTTGQAILLAITTSPHRRRCCTVQSEQGTHPSVLTRDELVAFVEGLRPAGRQREGSES